MVRPRKPSDEDTNKHAVPDVFDPRVFKPELFYSAAHVESVLHWTRHVRYRLHKSGELTPRYLPGANEPLYAGFELRALLSSALPSPIEPSTAELELSAHRAKLKADTERDLDEAQQRADARQKFGAAQGRVTFHHGPLPPHGPVPTPEESEVLVKKRASEGWRLPTAPNNTKEASDETL
jgi:hypothetical protein